MRGRFDEKRNAYLIRNGNADVEMVGLQVRRERRAEAAKDAINRWKGTIEVNNC